MHHQTDRQNHERFAAFSITENDQAQLRGLGNYGNARFPQLLEELHSAFARWPEIRTALMDPSVHRVRLAHWQRMLRGDLGDGFIESARQLAATFLDHKVPAYALTLCHFSVSDGVIRDLELDRSQRLPSRGAATRRGQRIALQKAAWFDLEVLLEAYAEAETALRRRTAESFAQALEARMSGVVGDIDLSTRDLDQTTRSIASAAHHSASHVSAIAGAMAEANSGVQTVAAAAEELSASVAEIMQQVGQSTKVAERAVEDARRTDTVVKALSEGASRIGVVVRLIEEVAQQTNLLALNATIEAARAGDAGKGFAVVANEVKQLAAQTAKATADIGTQITQMQAATAEAVQAISSIVGTITEMRDISSGIASAVKEQGMATSEIAQSATQAAVSNQQVDQLIGGIQGDTGQTTEAAEHLNSSVQSLSVKSTNLVKAVESLLVEVRLAA